MKKKYIQNCLVIFVTILSLLILPACTVQKENKQPLQNDLDKMIETDENDDKLGAYIGDKAHDFIVLDKEGNEIRLSDLEGRPIFIYFWTTWCTDCVERIAMLEEIYKDYLEQDVVLLFVDVLSAEKGKEKGEINKFLEENGHTLPIVYDIDGKISEQYNVRNFPTIYMISKEGKITDFVTTSLDKEEIIEMIENARE